MQTNQTMAGSFGFLAVVLFLAGVSLPIVIADLQRGLALGFPLWEVDRFHVGLLVFIGLALLPLARPYGRSWIVSLVGAPLLVPFATFILISNLLIRTSIFQAALLLLIFAGICLAVEAMLARRYALAYGPANYEPLAVFSNNRSSRRS